MNRIKETTVEKRNTYRDEIITIGDLEDFRIKLLEDLKTILKEIRAESGKKWLKSNEVKKMLGISTGTLQNLRINGTLPSTKIGGIVFYDQEDIQRILQENKQ